MAIEQKVAVALPPLVLPSFLPWLSLAVALLSACCAHLRLPCLLFFLACLRVPVAEVRDLRGVFWRVMSVCCEVVSYGEVGVGE